MREKTTEAQTGRKLRPRSLWIGGATLLIFSAVVAVLALVWPGFAVRGGEPASEWPTVDWATSTPEEQGMDSAKLEAMKVYIDEHDIPIDSVVVVRHGRMVFEMYGPGYSYSLRHRLQSVTKSVTSMLVGIGIDQGAIKGLDTTISELLPDYTSANPDPRRDRTTLEHLLTMSDGIDWNEHEFPYDDTRNQVSRMFSSSDAVQYVLDRPMAYEPGEVWAYNSGASLLLGEAVEEATGRDLLVYAREELFDPLGIGPVYWEKTASGHYQTGGGLSMAPRDMARLGYLMLRKGIWEGQQILSADWVERSTVARYPTFGPVGYGYQWWILPDDLGYRAQGLYEQYIYVLPGLDMVIVFTADIRGGLYRVDGLVNTFVLPACNDSVAPVSSATYAEHGFTLEYPGDYVLEEAPIQGRSTVSDEAGMVQITSNTEPLELLLVVWSEVEEGEEVSTMLEAYLSGFAAEVGELTPGESRDAQKDGHAMALRFSRVALEGGAFPMVSGAWICDASGLAYAVTYLTAGERSPEELLTGFEQHLAKLTCH